MKKGKIVKTVSTELPDSKVIKLFQEQESYKYQFLAEKMKVRR